MGTRYRVCDMKIPELALTFWGLPVVLHEGNLDCAVSTTAYFNHEPANPIRRSEKMLRENRPVFATNTMC